MFSIKNDSNREFSLDRLIIANDGVDVNEITNPDILSNNLLLAGYNHTITYKTKEDGLNNYTAIVDITDSLTGNKLSIQANLTIEE